MVSKRLCSRCDKERQAPRVEAVADVLRPINPGIILRKRCAITTPAFDWRGNSAGCVHVAICSAFKEPFQNGKFKRPHKIMAH